MDTTYYSFDCKGERTDIEVSENGILYLWNRRQGTVTCVAPSQLPTLMKACADAMGKAHGSACVKLMAARDRR